MGAAQRFNGLVESLENRVLFAAGDLDLTFAGGMKTLDIFGDSQSGFAVAVQADGKTLVAGRVRMAESFGSDFFVARFHTNGSLDTTFAGVGVVVTDFGSMSDGVYAMAVQPDGAIVVAGETVGAGSNYDFALARYTPAGVLDSSFGSGGKVVVDFAGGFDQAKALSILPGGGILVTGSGTVGGASQFALAKFTSTGVLDTTFGTGGKVSTAYPSGTSAAEAVLVLGDGSIVAAGSAAKFSDDNRDFAAVKYTATGAIDTSFGNSGWAIRDMGGDGDSVRAMLADTGGRVVLAGDNYNSVTGQSDFAMIRLTAGGAVDSSFGGAGVVLTDFNGEMDQALSAVRQTDGKIVLAGLASVDGVFQFAMARYSANGAVDSTFGNAGNAMYHWGAGGDVANAMTLCASGDLVVVGFTCDIDGNSDVAVARVLAEPGAAPPQDPDPEPEPDPEPPAPTPPAQFELIDDPNQTGKKILIFNGSDKNDRVEFKSVRGGAVEVRVNGKKLAGKFSNVSRIIAHGNDGDDWISARCADVPVELYGGKGNDRLVGSRFSDILVGGNGNDDLKGFHGNDLIVGGMGRDMLYSRLGDDLLIGGAITNEGDLANLRSILIHWNQMKIPLAKRVAVLVGQTIDDKAADLFHGTPGCDGIVAGAMDKVARRRWCW